MPSVISHLIASGGQFRAPERRIVSVEAYGAVGNDSTDDTSALQAAFNDTTDLVFPSNQIYRISSPLTLPFIPGRVIGGGGRHERCLIKQMTANVPILQATTTLTHSITLENLTLQYATQQTSSDTDAVGLLFAGDNASYFRWNLKNVLIDKAAYGVKIGGTNSCNFWNSSFEDVYITKPAISALSLIPSSSVGQPENSFRNLFIGAGPAYGGPTPTGIAVELNATEAVFTTLGIEGWNNRVLQLTGEGFCRIIGLHVESQTCTGATPSLFEVFNDRLCIEDAIISAESAAATYLTLFAQGTGSRVKIARWGIVLTDNGSSGVAVLNANVGGEYFDYEDVRSIGSLTCHIPFQAGGVGSGASSPRKITYAGRRVLPPTVAGVTTATWNPPALAAGAQQTTTVSVADAAIGDFVRCGFSQDLAGTTLVGYVSAAGTVTVVHRNGTAGAVDLASGTLSVGVERST